MCIFADIFGIIHGVEHIQSIWDLRGRFYIWLGFWLLLLPGKSNFCQTKFRYLDQDVACKCSWSLYHWVFS